MLSVLYKNKSAFVALFIFVLGNGFFATLISSVLTERNVSSAIIGLMTTSFYAGLVIGSFKIEHLISRVYHIRAYAAFASMLAAIALLHGIFQNEYIWLLLRFLSGFATAGIFIVIESWLLTQATATTRGQVLSLYMVAFYAAQSFGQFFLKLYNHNLLEMVVIISMCSSLSVIPLAMTKASSPEYTDPSTLGFRHLFKKCASGLIGSFIGGLVMGVIYGLFPVFLINQFHDPSLVATIMFTIIFGGMLFQYPIGRLSDSIERRLVLLVVSAVAVLIVAFMSFSLHSWALLVLLSAIFGGLTFTIYPISISYACDELSTAEIVSGTQTLLLAYSAGAMSGPIIASVFMHSFGEWGLFSYFITVLLTLAIFLGWRKSIKSSAPQEEAFIASPQITPIGLEVDPRGEADIDTTIEHRNAD